MKLLIASDLHGDFIATERLISRLKDGGYDKLVLLGDLLYHGPRNDLPAGYDPKGVIRTLNNVCDRILAVRGNCDAEVDQMVLNFPILADYAVLYLNGRTVYATHGHIHNMQTLPPLAPGDVLLHGHTHLYADVSFGNGNRYINPGSPSLPKEGREPTYMEYENGRLRLLTLDGRLLTECEL